MAAKKPEKKSAPKKPAPAKKSAAAKKPAAPVKKAATPAKKAAKQPKAEEHPKKHVHISIRLVKRPPAPKPPPAPVASSVGKPDSIAFAMSIAQEMKRSAKTEDIKRSEGEIRLAKRPVSRTTGQKSDRFPESDLKEFRKRLLDAREKAFNGANAMKATGFNESDDREADGGDGTNQTLRLQALGQMGNINRTIQQIEEALHRVEDGTYGVCTVCGQLIRKPRLLNQPFVLTCMECQSEMERNRNA